MEVSFISYFVFNIFQIKSGHLLCFQNHLLFGGKKAFLKWKYSEVCLSPGITAAFHPPLRCRDWSWKHWDKGGEKPEDREGQASWNSAGRLLALNNQNTKTEDSSHKLISVFSKIAKHYHSWLILWLSSAKYVLDSWWERRLWWKFIENYRHPLAVQDS